MEPMITEAKIKSHLEFLEQTLIPDLIESGNSATADDFRLNVNIIRQLQTASQISPFGKFKVYANRFMLGNNPKDERGLIARMKKEKNFKKWEKLYFEWSGDDLEWFYGMVSQYFKTCL